MQENSDAANCNETTPMSPSPNSSPESGKMKAWLKSKFRRGSKSAKAAPEVTTIKSGEKGFIGGTALTGATANVTNDSTGSLSMRNVALAGKTKESPPMAQQDSAARDSDVSSLDDSEEEFQEARDNFDDQLAPPQPQFPAQKSHSPARDSKFIEAI